jgi:hypothetical protein
MDNNKEYKGTNKITKRWHELGFLDGLDECYWDGMSREFERMLLARDHQTINYVYARQKYLQKHKADREQSEK